MTGLPAHTGQDLTFRPFLSGSLPGPCDHLPPHPNLPEHIGPTSHAEKRFIATRKMIESSFKGCVSSNTVPAGGCNHGVRGKGSNCYRIEQRYG